MRERKIQAVTRFNKLNGIGNPIYAVNC